MKIKEIVVGTPMGIKVNESELVNGLSLETLVEMTSCYHGGKVIIGKDTQFCEQPHYHIHWFSVKETSEGAIKTFRSNVIKKSYPHVSKSFRIYTGQQLDSADSNMWLGYCIKETLVRSDYAITEEIKVCASSQLQLKQMKKVHSEKKTLVEKEKKEFRDKIIEYVKENFDMYNPSFHGKEFSDYDKIRLLVIKYLKDNRIGSLRRGIIDTYVISCCIEILQWDEISIFYNLYGM